MTALYAVPLSEEELAFRDDVRLFIAEKLRPEWRGVSELWLRFEMEPLQAWTREVVAKGWATWEWPQEYGGRPMTLMQRYIFNTETALARAPLIPHINLHMVGTLICEFGNAWMKRTLLPRILDCSDFYSQGFSEPEAGSDLAAARTAAVRDGEDYLVNGQKIWSTNAHRANELFTIVRTNPDPASRHRGLSILLIPLDSPGLTVRPIRSIDGLHHLNEVFFDNVRVPAKRLLGEENEGWKYSMLMLAREREAIADLRPTIVMMNDVMEVAREAGLLEDAKIAERAQQLLWELDALEMMELRVLNAVEEKCEDGYEASFLKISGSTLRQEVLQFAREILGPLGAVMPSATAPRSPSGYGEHFVTDALINRAATIYGGSNEIQRNIVGKVAFSRQGPLL